MSIQRRLGIAVLSSLATITLSLFPSPAPLRAQPQATTATAESQPAPTRPRILDDSGNVVSECLWPAGQRQVVLKLTHACEFWLTRDVKINGQDLGWMLVDTGANVTTIDASLANDLHLPSLKAVPGTDYAACRKIDQVAAGSLQIRNHFVFTGDFAPLRSSTGVRIIGSLGGDVLSRQPFCLDPDAATLTFYDRSQFIPPPGARAEELVLGGRARSATNFARANPYTGFPMANILVDSVPCVMVLDSGDNGMLELCPSLCRKHPELVDRDAGVRDRKAVLGGWVDVYGVKARESVIFGRTTKLEANASAQTEDGPVAPVSADGVVGIRILENYRLTFDYAAGHLWTEYQPRKSVAERLAAGLDPNAKDPADWTPLLDTAIRGDPDGVRALLKAGAKADAVTATGMTAIRAATLSGNAEVLRILLAVDGLDVNARSAKGMSALMGAVGEPAGAEMIQMLAAKGADLSLVNAEGLTALEYAAMTGRLAAFEALWRAGARPPSKPRNGATLLHYAARDPSGNMVRHLLKGAEGTFAVDSRTDYGATPLMMAAEKGRVESVRALLDAGANVNLAAEGNGNFTALHSAAVAGSAETVELLLLHKAAVDARAVEGETALMYATDKGYLAVVETLLEHGAAGNAARKDGVTALMAAAQGGYDPIVESLLKHGADVKMASVEGGTALHAAARAGQLETVRILLKAGAPLNATMSADHLTPLDLAQRAGHTEVANLLRQAATQPATTHPAP